jgi:hypothetical protein
MGFIKLKIVVAIAFALLGLIVSFALRQQTQAQLHEREIRLRQYHSQIAMLTAENQRFSNIVMRARDSESNLLLQDYTVELARLRSEAEALRNQTNELGRLVAEARRTRPLPNVSMPYPYGPGHSSLVISDSDSDDYKEKLYQIGAASPHSGPFNIDARKDAQNLAHALRSHALEHAGEVPTSFDQIAPEHFIKSYRVPDASGYEIIYHGSLDDLTDIPQQAVALIREREPWPTPGGKLGRIYVMVNGFVKIVESADNFQSWEAEHIIPPR